MLRNVYVAKTSQEKATQRALLQYYNPKNSQVVREALRTVHREDLIPVLVGAKKTKSEIAYASSGPKRKNAPVKNWQEMQKRNRDLHKGKR